MPTCSAYGCSYKDCRKKVPGKTTHRFPFSRPQILKYWVLNVRRANWKPSLRSVLCSDHFEPECFNRTGHIVRLHRDAVPTLFNFPSHVQKVVKGRKLTSRMQFQDNELSTSTALVVNKSELSSNEDNVPSSTAWTVGVNKLAVANDHNYYATVCQLKRKITDKENAKKIKMLQQSIRRMKKKLESADMETNSKFIFKSNIEMLE